MRHGASLVSAMEGMGRAAFRIAKELVQSSRSGLTIRFLSKKLDLPTEETEYLVDLHPRLMFYDLTKVKLAAEGQTAVRRVLEGLENYGDVPSLFRRIKDLTPHEFRRFEEQIGLERPGARKSAAEELLKRFYEHPDSVVEYVATRGFSATARELLDIVWQSPAGVMPASRVAAAHGGPAFDVEQGLWELFRGFALFEMFRFDAEDRLVRAAGLLSEIRQWRETSRKQKSGKVHLRTYRGASSGMVDSRGVRFTDQVCRLVAALAARPARLRSDGELFREDWLRLCEICPEDVEPVLATCLWVAEGVGWVTRIGNELCAGELEPLLALDRLHRHRILYEWLGSSTNEAAARRVLTELMDEAKPGVWHSTMEFVDFAAAMCAEHEQPVLKCAGGHWRYLYPSASEGMQRTLARSLEESLLWLGVVDRTEEDGQSLFRITDLGRWLLTGQGGESLAAAFPERGAHIVVQPNFDIVVPTHDIDPLVTVPLDQFGKRVSTGQATVYHVSKESFTRALQAGHDGNAFVEFLIGRNRKRGLPPNVMTTLEDWRGGIRRVRLRTLHVMETDDPLVLADIMHRRRFKKHLQAFPSHNMVRFSKISKAELAKELEKDGFIVE